MVEQGAEGGVEGTLVVVQGAEVRVEAGTRAHSQFVVEGVEVYCKQGQGTGPRHHLWTIDIREANHAPEKEKNSFNYRMRKIGGIQQLTINISRKYKPIS